MSIELVEFKIKIRTIFGMIFFFFILGWIVWSRIELVISPIPEEPVDYSVYAWYLVPVMYIIDYFKHAAVSLIFAFFISRDDTRIYTSKYNF